jgi:hypothetical protein
MTCTVPRYVMTVLLNASWIVTVTSNGMPDVTVSEAATSR